MSLRKSERRMIGSTAIREDPELRVEVDEYRRQGVSWLRGAIQLNRFSNFRSTFAQNHCPSPFANFFSWFSMSTLVSYGDVHWQEPLQRSVLFPFDVQKKIATQILLLHNI